MCIVGIIAEFNPFHNGHKYLIEQAKKLTHADSVVVVMSGNYVQRGTPAICDKFLRTQMAIENGCDLVIELPIIYSCASARYFAQGAIHLLNSLGCVDYVAFGAEYSNIDVLYEIAELLSQEPPYFCQQLNFYLKNGHGFPSARERAVCDAFLVQNPSFDQHVLHEILSSPNCILALEYLCALKKFNSDIRPVPVQRVLAPYHQAAIEDNICSATALRNTLKHRKSLPEAGRAVPDSVYTLLQSEYEISLPIHEDDFSSIAGAALTAHLDILQTYYDFSPDFSNRVRNLTDYYDGFSSFTDRLVTKNITRAYSSRCLLHLMLGIKTNFVKQVIAEGYHSYIRILGLKKSNAKLLHNIKIHSELPMITKLSSAADVLTPTGKELLLLNQRADDWYRLTQNLKYKSHLPNEYRRGIYVKL